MRAEGAAEWPQQWRWTEQRERQYYAKGLDAMQVVDVEIVGVRETGVLLPMSRVPLRQGIGSLLVGVPLLACALVLAVLAIVNQTWAALGGVLVLGVFGGLPALVGYAALTTRKTADPGLYLTPTRIALGSGRHQIAVPWQDIADISLHTTDRGQGRLSPKGNNFFWIDVHDLSKVHCVPGSKAAKHFARAAKPGPALRIVDDRLMVNPLLAYHAVRHYFDHPAERRNIVSDARPR